MEDEPRSSMDNRGFVASRTVESDAEGTPGAGHGFVLLSREQRLEALTLDFSSVRRNGPRRIGQAGVAEAHAFAGEGIDMRLGQPRGIRPADERMGVVSIRINVAIGVGRMVETLIIDHRARVDRGHAEEVGDELAMGKTHSRRGQTNALSTGQCANGFAKALVEQLQAVDFKRFLVHGLTPLRKGYFDCLPPRNLIASWRYYLSNALAWEILLGGSLAPIGLQRRTILCRAITRHRFGLVHRRSLDLDRHLRLVGRRAIGRNRYRQDSVAQ